MREAGDAGHFVAAAGVDPVVERDFGNVVVGPDDDLHAVRERDGGDLALAWHLRERLAGGEQGGHGKQSAQLLHVSSLRQGRTNHSGKKNAASGEDAWRRASGTRP
jgi:hypothetical protein